MIRAVLAPCQPWRCVGTATPAGATGSGSARGCRYDGVAAA
ncbi:MAG: hypothetical protein QOH97_2012, partial [Actinoplanes sp.]|nr:hypothetical protein [Actinoplanes sp.]